MASSMVKAAATTAVTIAALSLGLIYYIKGGEKAIQESDNVIRSKLPKTLDEWRSPGQGDIEDDEKIWRDIDPILKRFGLEQWPHRYNGLSYLRSPSKIRLASGFAYIGPSRATGDGVGTVYSLSSMQYWNPTFRIARTREGHDVAVRIIILKDEGHHHLKILKKVATGPLSLLSNNHCLPMLKVLEFQDITLGLFPLAGGVFYDAFDCWPQDSVGDVLDMILQALEGLAFLHASNIAHRDADKTNFVVQWFPESLRTQTVAVSRPRVYIIDFEVAVEFPKDFPPDQRVCVGPPSGGTIGDGEYQRPLPPEVMSGKPYCPFKLDVWHFGCSFTGPTTFKTTIPAIDEILAEWVIDDPASRPSSSEALAKLSKVVNSLPPKALLIQPVVTTKF